MNRCRSGPRFDAKSASGPQNNAAIASAIESADPICPTCALRDCVRIVLRISRARKTGSVTCAILRHRRGAAASSEEEGLDGELPIAEAPGHAPALDDQNLSRIAHPILPEIDDGNDPLVRRMIVVDALPEVVGRKALVRNVEILGQPLRQKLDHPLVAVLANARAAARIEPAGLLHGPQKILAPPLLAGPDHDRI